MLRSLKSLESYHVTATDGDVGMVVNFLFDDHHWTIRYLVVDTGGFWKGPHRVLISPIAFRNVDWSSRRFHLALDREKVAHSPTVDVDRPVSEQFEQEYHRYYGWSPYWGIGPSWGFGTYPGALAGSTWKKEQEFTVDPKADSHLRSARTVTGYAVDGGDDVLGHIADFIVDDETWAVRYLVVDTQTWWSGKKVLVSPQWAREISWKDEAIRTDIPRQVLKNSPEWNAHQPVNREYEVRLYDYYGRPTYWLDTAKPGTRAPDAQFSNERHSHP